MRVWLAISALVALLITGCGGPGEMPADGHTVTSTSVTELGELVTLPAQPRSVAWELVDDPAAPQRQHLTAVLEFGPEDADRILEVSTPLEPPRSAMLRSIPDWFPAAARDALESVHRAGRIHLLGSDLARNSALFDSPRLAGGFVTRIGNSPMLYLSIGARAPSPSA